MDAHTLGLLEYDKVRQLLAGYVATSLGRELALRVEPFTELADARCEMALVTEMVRELDAGAGPSFGGLQDVRLIIRRAAIGTMLAADQLLDVAAALSCTGSIYRFRSTIDERHQGLLELLAGVEDLGGVARTIMGCIDSRAHVLDMASVELTAIRGKLFDLDEKVKSEIRRLLRDPELRRILSYPNATVNGDHYVLPVAVNHRHKVAGVVHRVSGTGETVFIEPAAIAVLSAERMTLKAEEDRETKRVLRRLTAEVGRVAKPLLYSLDIIAKLDLIAAKARMSRDYRMSAPELNDEGRLWLKQARHPVLEHLIRQAPPGRGDVVPIDLRLGLGFNILVITGPNTGGKTVTLKTAGLLAAMALSGMHIPAADGSSVPYFDRILADIGDEQSLEQSLSTFSSHMTQIASILSHATANSLVLLDELGAGTDPVEGAALGRAILDGLDATGCRAIVTTHLGDLKTYALVNDHAENGAVEFDVETLQPTYRLKIGEFGQSNALTIARRLNLPEAVLKRARRYLHKGRRRRGEIQRLQELRQAAERARVEALADRQAAERERSDLEQRRIEADRAAEREQELFRARQSLKIGDRVSVRKFDDIGVVTRIDLKRQTALVSIGFGQWEVPLGEISPLG